MKRPRRTKRRQSTALEFDYDFLQMLRKEAFKKDIPMWMIIQDAVKKCLNKSSN